MELPFFLSDPHDNTTGADILDAYSTAIQELFFIQNPQLKKNSTESTALLKKFVKESTVKKCYVYYPWKNLVVCTVDEQTYFLLRTSRNRNIISSQEQQAYRNLSVGIAGLSVGSCIVNALTISGGPKHMKIADFDVLEVTNLNRIRGSLTQIGQNKITIAAEAIWELDPFAKLTLYEKGLDKNNISNFLLDNSRLDIFIDEMDSLDVKILARILCKEHRIPVIMATDNGDGIILDIERFDKEPNRPIFHGLLDNEDLDQVKRTDYKTWLKLATKIVGPEYLTPKMQQSLLGIGTKIPAVPQLGTTAAIAGSAVAFVARRIANGDDVPSGRYLFGLEEKLIPHYMDSDSIKKREEQTKMFENSFGQNHSL